MIILWEEDFKQYIVDCSKSSSYTPIMKQQNLTLNFSLNTFLLLYIFYVIHLGTWMYRYECMREYVKDNKNLNYDVNDVNNRKCVMK